MLATCLRKGVLAMILAQQTAAPVLAASPASALYAQAVALEHGEGVPRDPERAARLYCKAVRAGDREAMHALGWMYAHGRGIERDDSLASTMFAMAAYLGHEQAEAMLQHLGAYHGEVPECLVPPPEEQVADVDRARGSLHYHLERQPPVRHRLIEMVARLAPEYGIDPRLALAVAAVESDFEARAVSERMAQGLMQLIPETAERFNVRDPLDPEQNVRGGLAYLRWLLAYFEGQTQLVIAAYNAGERAVDRYRGVPPYRETRDYVVRVRAHFQDERHPYREGWIEPSPLAAAAAELARAESRQ